jgi:signal transduction histidine kinase
VLPDEIDRIIQALEVMWTDARHAFEQLEDEKRRADRLYLSLRDSTNEQAALSTALSHDLISPVNTLHVLLGELQGLRATPAEQALRDELMDDLCQTADRIRHQIQSVVLYSEILSNPVKKTAVDLELVLQGVRREMNTTFDLFPDQITFGALGQVLGDPEELRLLFRALISNALTYASPGRHSEIHIAASEAQSGPYLQIELTDNGRGIADEHQQSIFGLFSRLHTYADIPGTGMGLALCRRLMERHGGDISLRSAEGNGTTILLSFQKGDMP